MTKNLKNLDLNLLVIFEAIYRNGNISRAAESLGMSQPAVSNALGRLREAVDDPLFVRSPRGVEPTAKARELIHPLRDALGLIGRHLGTASEIDLSTYKRLFRIIIVDPLEPIIMPPVIKVLTTMAPHIDIECTQAHPRVTDDLKAGTIDLACFPFPVDTTDIVFKPIMTLDPVVISRRNHPEIVKPLDVETFERLPHIGLRRELRGLAEVDKSLSVGTRSRRVAYMASKIWSIPAMVERTDLISMLPRSFCEEIQGNFAIDMHEMPIAVPEQHIYMLWHASSENDPGHIWLREEMMRALRSNRGPQA